MSTFNEPNPRKSLSEISHLFLSSVRERQTGGATRPVRKPPVAPVARETSIDLTPEEFASVFADSTEPFRTERIASDMTTPVTAIVGTHLNGSLSERAREYAGHLCGEGSRIGLIECDSSIFRLMLFERNPGSTVNGESEGEPISAEAFDARKMRESLEELSVDVDRWLILLPSARTTEAREILRQIDHWVLLSTCDHDGVVGCYRTLKGLADLNRPRISLALLGTADEEEADRVFQKLSSVSQQFLNWPLEAEPPVHRPQDVAERFVLCCRATRDRSPQEAAPQWQIVSEFLGRTRSAVRKQEAPMPTNPAASREEPKAPEIVADVVVPERIESPPVSPVSAAPVATIPVRHDSESDVIDLPEGHTTPAAIVSAVLHGGSNQLVECPVKPPMCPDASLAVGRDHRLTLVAVARQGLTDLRNIGRAYQWLIENRGLVAMALPQFAVDAHQLPRLQLLVDQADLTAEILQPVFQSSNVTVVAYRKLRWAGRIGLLLNAA